MLVFFRLQKNKKLNHRGTEITELSTLFFCAVGTINKLILRVLCASVVRRLLNLYQPEMTIIKYRA